MFIKEINHKYILTKYKLKYIKNKNSDIKNISIYI